MNAHRSRSSLPRTGSAVLFLALVLALTLGVAGQARPAGGPDPDSIVFLDSNLEVTLSAPPQALSGRRFTVQAEVAETTGNASAWTSVELVTGSATLRSKPISIGASGHATVTFPVLLQGDGPAALEARIAQYGQEPDADDVAAATVEVTQFQVDLGNILLPSLVGYGGQMNHHLFYKPLNPNVPPGAPALEEKVKTLEPQLVRLFFPPLAATQPDRLASFLEVLELAQESGAVINVTWQSNSSSIQTNMSRFATVLADAVKNRGITNLRWVTLLNEPNSTAVPLATYELMYRTLDGFLVAAGVRDQIRFMGGDLVQNRQREYLQYMAANMTDMLDAYSVHIFWNFWDTGTIAQRLEDVRKIDREELPQAGRKPIYIMEYGVRGIRSPVPGEPQVPEPGEWFNRIPMAQSNINAFQLGWFDVLSARLGYPGTVIWDMFNAKYDNGTQDYSTIGPAPDFELRPSYFLLRLFTATTEPGWRIVGLDGEADGKLLTAYNSTDGMLTVVGLDRSGGQLNDASGGPAFHSIAGLPSLTTFRLVVWNGDGNGRLTSEQVVTTDALGIARLTVPTHAVWALTTHPIAD